jgi:hypothetical protein
VRHLILRSRLCNSAFEWHRASWKTNGGVPLQRTDNWRHPAGCVQRAHFDAVGRHPPRQSRDGWHLPPPRAATTLFPC